MRIAVVTVKKSLVNLGSPKDFDACDTSGSLHKNSGWEAKCSQVAHYHS